MPIAAVELQATGGLRWNGRAVSRSELREHLVAVTRSAAPIAVTLRVDDAAACADVQTIRDELEQVLPCETSGLCGEGAGEWQP